MRIHGRQFVTLLASTLLACVVTAGAPAAQWDIILARQLQQDEAIRVAIEDLKQAGTACGVSFEIKDDQQKPERNCILVGDATQNEQTSMLASGLGLAGITHPQGYHIITRNLDGHKVMIVTGGSIVGEVHGLYWIWDRLRVERSLPDIQVRRQPVLENRISLAWGRSGGDGDTREEMRNALRYGLNWVSGPAILDMVPWSAEPERSQNEKNRARARELIRYAHSLHLKYFSFANEFTYHPDLLKEFGASLSPCDPAFWDAVQAKFRKLFQALPELDGVELCNDDLSGFWDNYRSFDVMHDPPECSWPLDLRFRTFVQKVYDVAVNEFHKTYFHFTWSLVSFEQHNQPDVFRKIFTAAVPVTNLFLIPKLTAADRWWFQPYNPTFNQTPHRTLVGFETMNYYESSSAHLFPTFAGQYYQAGLQLFLKNPQNNIRGSGYRAGPDPAGWDSQSVAAYVLWRLSWDPDEDIRQIARDFCAIHFGAEAAEGLAQIYLLSPTAYKYGLHIEPVSYGQFNSLLQMRVATFPAAGYPEIDGGKEHLDFLQDIWLQCKPWQAETYSYLDRGLAKAAEMESLYLAVKPKIQNAVLAREVENALRMTRLLIRVNNLYVKTAFAFFAYREIPSEEKREALRNLYEQLSAARDEFVHAPGFDYQLFGVDQLARNVKEMIEDRARAESRLAKAPTRKVIENTILQQQEKYRQVLLDHASEAVKFLHFDGAIDGQDILSVNASQWHIEHLRWDGPEIKECKVLRPLPKMPLCVIPQDIESRPLHQFVIEQPSQANSFTAKIYLNDAPGGKGINRFDLYYVLKKPEELGLSVPWQ
ncbi:MAG: hypothetical protein HY298_24165 [Verrucomicrobia bacterium]|nr:hypothetical protein [Verrucomicrobiota bacterium]